MNKPLSKALADIPVGERSMEHGKGAFDYTHVLEPYHHEALPDAKVIVKWYPGNYEGGDPTGWLRGELRQGTKKLGEIEGDLYTKDEDGRKFLAIQSSDVRGAPREHNGRKTYFGRKLYEAVMAHAMNTLGATHVGGGTHSTYASLAHRWLADRHGMLYDPTPNTEENKGLADPAVADMAYGNPQGDESWGHEGQAPKSFDERYAPYAYTLKSEDLSAVPVGQLKGTGEGEKYINLASGTQPKGPAEYYDYDHLLHPEHLKDGYRLEVITHPGPDGVPVYAKARVRGPFHVGLHDRAAQVEGQYNHPDFHISYALVDNDHKDKNLGKACYEALMAHMKNKHDARAMIGDTHTAKADAAHKALANKYGLEWQLKPVSKVFSDPEEQMYSSYALKLHELVSTSLAMPLAKDEVTGDDPVAQRIDQLAQPGNFQYADLELLMHENDFQPKHLAYLMRKTAAGYGTMLMNAMVRSPKFSPEVVDEAYKGYAEPGNETLLRSRHDMLGRISSIDPACVNDETGGRWFFDQLSSQLKTEEEHGWEKRSTASTKRHLLNEGCNNLNILTPEQLSGVPLDHADDYSSTRRRFVNALTEKYTTPGADGVVPAMPEAMKTNLLEYLKKMTSSIEKATTSSRGNAADEFESTSDGITNAAIKTGVPAGFLRRTSKNLFNLVLSSAPNYPAAKVKPLIDHYTSENAPAFKNQSAKRFATSYVIKSPHLSPEAWGNLVINSAGGLPTNEIVASPNFTEEIAKKMYERAPDWDLIRHMRDANKITPGFADWFVNRPLANEETQVAKYNEDVAKAKAVLAAQDPNSPYPEWKQSPDNGMVLGRWDTIHPAFQQNPYKLNDEGMIREGWETLGQHVSNPEDFLNRYADRVQKMIQFRPEGVTPLQAANHYANCWGMSNYDYPCDYPYELAHRMGFEKLTPNMNMRLARFMTDTLQHHDTSEARQWLQTTKDEAAITHVLRNSSHAFQISQLLGRQDAKPEWVAAVESRPEFQNVPVDPNRFGDANNRRGSPRWMQSGQNFHDEIKQAVYDSPGFGADRVDAIVKNAKQIGDITRFFGHAGFKPETMNWIMDQKGGKLLNDYEKDANGNTVVNPRTGEYVRKVEGGTVPWDEETQKRLVYEMVNNYRDAITPDQWHKLRDTGYLDATQPSGSNYARAIAQYSLSASQTPTDVLQYLYDLANTPEGMQNPYVSDMAGRVMLHQNAPPGLVEKSIEDAKGNPDKMNNVYLNILAHKSNIAPELLNKMIEYQTAVSGPVPNFDPATGKASWPKNYGFWNTLAENHQYPEELAKQTFQGLQQRHAEIEAYKQANQDVDHYKIFNGRSIEDAEFFENLKKMIRATDPDSAYTQHPKVTAKVGSHPYRVLRDMIEGSGGQVHLSEIQKHPIFSKLPVDKARVMRPMTQEEYQKKFEKMPEKKRPPFGPHLNVKTDFVSSEGVQGLIDALPPTNTWNVSSKKWREYTDQMSNPKTDNDVFQFNVTTDHIRKLKAAGLHHILQKLQRGPLQGGGIHPMTGDSLGWIRYYPVTGDGTVTVDEIQSDIRPPGGSWVMAEKGAKGLLPGQNGNGWKGQAIRNIIGNSCWGGAFPAADMDKFMEIVVGKKTDIHTAMMEAFMQHLRDQGHHNVKVFLPGVGLQSAMRYGWSGVKQEDRNFDVPPTDETKQKVGIDKDAPEHTYDTHQKMPEGLAFDMNSAKYGDAPNHNQERHSGWSTTMTGWPMHTTKISKKMEEWRNLMKGIDTLPELPFVRNNAGERIYDASHYLTPEHRKKGYRMDVRTGNGIYGKYNIVNVMHGQNIVGGASSYIGDDRIVDGETRRYVQPDLVGLKDQHVGQGLGLPIYEALFASAKKHFGATHVKGLQHSSMASSVHKKIAAKYGLNYDPEPNFPSSQYANGEAWEAAPNAAMDGKWGPYSYTL